MMNRLKRVGWYLAASSLLTACSLLAPVKNEGIKEYMVDVNPLTYRANHSSSQTIVVSMPIASAIYKEKDMVYSTHAHQFNYFAKNRWAETPSQMFQPLIIQALQNTHHYKAIAPAVGLGRFDLLLNTQIVEFYQDFCAGGVVFKLTLRAQMIRVSTGRVLGSKVFTVYQPSPMANPYGGVLAANQASEKVMNELARWSIKYH